VPEDLEYARRLAAPGPAGVDSIRTGTGYDLHRLVTGRPLVLGGVTIPFDRGALGHSDADALSHAITDAILGAAGAGDIGRHFPDTSPQWKDASSLDLLSRAAAIVRQAGFDVSNVDATIILERPKLLPYLNDMRQNLAAALEIGADRISIKAKTNEGTGEIGRGEAIAVHAAALISRRSQSREP
jgi:2-C-methyl-D-erythritol 2,4-cyclodiphosphate synthase